MKIVDNNYYIIEENCCYEKLYTKYSGKTAATVNENEYLLAFNMIKYKDDEPEWHYGYKWLNIVSIVYIGPLW